MILTWTELDGGDVVVRFNREAAEAFIALIDPDWEDIADRDNGFFGTAFKMKFLLDSAGFDG